METWLEQIAREGVRPVADPMFAVTYPASMLGREQRLQQHRLRFLAADPESLIALNRLLLSVDLLSGLPSIRCPVRVIGCRHDAIRPPARCAEIAALMPRATFVIADSGHYMPIQDPELFVAQLSGLN
jgi:3-oxoadipate enol-lactonase